MLRALQILESQSDFRESVKKPSRDDMLFNLLVSLLAVSAAQPAPESRVADVSTALTTKQRCLRSPPFIMLPLANHIDTCPMYVLLHPCIMVSY